MHRCFYFLAVDGKKLPEMKKKKKHEMKDLELPSLCKLLR